MRQRQLVELIYLSTRRLEDLESEKKKQKKLKKFNVEIFLHNPSTTLGGPAA